METTTTTTSTTTTNLPGPTKTLDTKMDTTSFWSFSTFDSGHIVRTLKMTENGQKRHPAGLRKEKEETNSAGGPRVTQSYVTPMRDATERWWKFSPTWRNVARSTGCFIFSFSLPSFSIIKYTTKTYFSRLYFASERRNQTSRVIGVYIFSLKYFTEFVSRTRKL